MIGKSGNRFSEAIMLRLESLGGADPHSVESPILLKDLV
jgi:hypothetical protein